jgi:RNAse (barnase) inhibitor barstar
MNQDNEFRGMSISNIIGSSNALKIAIEIDNFRTWLNKNHKDINISEILPGYKFFLESIIDMLALSIVNDYTLEIQEDPIYFRAFHFVEIDINRVPSTCEKTAILKNFQKELREIRKANSFDQLSAKTKKLSNNVILPFFLIFSKHCVVNSKMSREKSLKVATMWMTHIYLSDTEKGVPKSVLLTPLSRLNEDEFRKSFLGYKIGLQYLWSQLLGRNFNKTSLSKLIDATDWTSENESFFNLGEDYNQQQKKRTDLDTFFSIIQDEIMEPLEKEWKQVKLNYQFRLRGTNPKKYLDRLFSYNESLSLTEDEKLKNILLWYDIELLDASQNAIFNGVPAFLTLLPGAVELKSIFAKGDQAIVCKFVHPVSSDENDYSYGVLIETGSAISDNSGWILCYDCCSDYGSTDVNQGIAEMLIEKYKKENKILLRELTIDKNRFKKGISENIIHPDKRKQMLLGMELTDMKNEADIKIGNAKGLVLEFLTYYAQTKNENEKCKIDWNIKENENELDVICESDENYHLIECKVTPENMELEDDFRKIERKLQGHKTNKKRIGQFWFYSWPDQNFHNKYKDLQKLYSKDNLIIGDYVIVKERLENDPVWRKKKKDKVRDLFEKQIFSHDNAHENLRSHQYFGSF